MGTGILEDPPQPESGEVLQREILAPALLIHPDGPVHTIELPARIGPMFKEALTTAFVKVLGKDEKRKRIALICDVDWLVSRTGAANSGVPWYAKVPLPIGHCDEIWAAVPTSTGTLSVIAEIWPD